MTQDFVFIGNPGPHAAAMLRLIHESGLSPKRVMVSDNLAQEIAENPPVSILFATDVEDMEQIIRTLREERALTSTPVIALVKKPDAGLLEISFRNGIDDYLVEGSLKQFQALVSFFKDDDTWRAVRAPAGHLILAHADRAERVRLGQVLRRNGFDTTFAAATSELQTAISRVEARAIISSSDLPGKPVMDVVAESGLNTEGTPPWVLVAAADEIEKLSTDLPTNLQCSFFEAGADAEGLTFVLNEMLAPPPVGARRSPRILYGTPISFKPIGGEVPFYGYTFNVNLGGLYIRSLTGLPLQTRIEVAFTPPFGRGQVVAHAQVVWCKGLGDTEGAVSPPGMGIQFIDMWPPDQAAFEAGYEILHRETQEKRPTVQ
ncbi:MAG: PilZ domain-containing protein [Myxococcota bacterium]|nr:PilZ domain-containing protein [Myxococcota bacterium]